MTEWLHFHFSLNGNPLQCSCLENLRGRGAWWAAVYGVAQSRTRLKWLSNLATVLLGLLLCPWTWCIFFWWGPTFSCWWLFSSKSQFWSSHRRRWVHVLPHCQCPRILYLVVNSKFSILWNPSLVFLHFGDWYNFTLTNTIGKRKLSAAPLSFQGSK